MARHGIKRLVFSSTAAILELPEYTPIDEHHPKAVAVGMPVTRHPYRDRCNSSGTEFVEIVDYSVRTPE